MSTSCSTCGAPIIWALTAAGKRIPIDAAPTSGGNVQLLEQAGRAPRAVVGGVAGLPAGVPLYTSHFATCPNAEEHRKRGAA